MEELIAPSTGGFSWSDTYVKQFLEMLNWLEEHRED